MRGSKTKKLRRFAEISAAKLPALAYQPKKPIMVMPRGLMPMPGMPTPRAEWTGQAELANCVRRTYLQFKRRYKAQNQHGRRMTNA